MIQIGIFIEPSMFSFPNNTNKQNTDPDETLQRLNLLQIQFDEMMQFSSHLVKEKEELAVKNEELQNVVDILEENAKVDTDKNNSLEAEVFHLKQELSSTRTKLQEVVAVRDVLLSRIGESEDSSVKVTRSGMLHRYTTHNHAASFRIDGETKKMRYKSLQVTLEEKLNQKNNRIVLREPTIGKVLEEAEVEDREKSSYTNAQAA